MADPSVKKDKTEVTTRLLRAGWHPIQIRALTVLIERVASPKEVALELGMTRDKAGLVSYHIKELLKRNLVELVREEKVRGAIAHFYKARAPLIVTDEDAARMSPEERLEISSWVITLINGDFGQAIESRSIDERPDRHLSRFPLHLDEQGYLDLIEDFNRLFYRTQEIKAESEERLRHSAEQARPVSAVLACFPMPLVERP